MCLNQTGNTSTLDGSSQKLVDKFTALGSSISSTEKDIDTRLAKAWTVNDSLSVIWKSDLTDKMKRRFFQAAVVSILLYGCTTWTLTKRIEKKLDGNYTRMLRAILNKSWRQDPTKQQLYNHLPPITKTIKVSRTRHSGQCFRGGDELISDVLLWTPHMAVQKQGDQLESTYSSSVRIRDLARRTWQKRWTIWRSGERGSVISELVARQDDNESSFHLSWHNIFPLVPTAEVNQVNIVLLLCSSGSTYHISLHKYSLFNKIPKGGCLGIYVLIFQEKLHTQIPFIIWLKPFYRNINLCRSFNAKPILREE